MNAPKAQIYKYPRFNKKMKYIIMLILATFGLSETVLGQSSLLQSVKQNPSEALALCSQFKDLNSKGISASSKESIQEISNKKNLSQVDAEILSMYVRGLHCPDVL